MLHVWLFAEIQLMAPKKAPKKGPKKPMPAYMFFSQERRKVLIEDKPELKSNVTAISKILGAEWRGMSEEDKQPYKDLYDKDKSRFEREKEDWADDSDNEPVAPPPAKKRRVTVAKPKKEPEKPVSESEDESAAGSGSGSDSGDGSESGSESGSDSAASGAKKDDSSESDSE